MLYTAESGSPASPAILFLHGGGLSSKMWQPQFERLPDYYCLAPDLPEQGRSLEVKPFDLEDSARRVMEIIRERVPAGKAHIVGLSLGGAVGLTLLRMASEVVDRALVSGTAAVLGKGLGRLTLASLWMLRFWKPEKMVEATIRQQAIPDQYRDLVYQDLLVSATESFNRNVIRALMEMRLPERAYRPLLATVGEKETLTARQAAQKLVRKVTGTKGAIVPGCGHVWNLQDSDLFTGTVKAWINAAPLPSGLQVIV